MKEGYAIVKKSHMKNGTYVKSHNSYEYYRCISYQSKPGWFYTIIINDIKYYYTPEMYGKYYTTDIIEERKLERKLKLQKINNIER